MQFDTQSDRTVRTVTIKPSKRTLIQFDAYFRNTGVYEVQNIVVTIEDDAIEAVIHGRKVSKAGAYISQDWHVYNKSVEAQAIEYVQGILAAEAVA